MISLPVMSLMSSKVKVSQLRRVQIQDSPGRESVQMETDCMRDILSGKVAIVAGAGRRPQTGGWT